MRITLPKSIPHYHAENIYGEPGRWIFSDGDNISVLPRDEDNSTCFVTDERIEIEARSILAELTHPNLIGTLYWDVWRKCWLWYQPPNWMPERKKPDGGSGL